MAALLFRAFWPTQAAWSSLGLPVAGLYSWLGLAMSGPIVILRRRLSRSPHIVSGPDAEDTRERSLRSQGVPIHGTGTTWAERAWLLIGIYWVVLGIFTIPARLHEFRLGDVILFGIAPVVVAIGLSLNAPNAPQAPHLLHWWTHAVAIALLVTWPLAWICLIVLGSSLA
jgi:hypothetical protein